MVVVFGCDRSLKGVVGRGWVRCLGYWLWLGCGFGVWVVGDGVGQWWLWVVDRRGCGLWVMDRRGWVVVVDRRAGMNGSLVVHRRLKWVVGRGWVVVGLWLRWLR